jgi:sterol desaturase/sphingolipid hydroxylase (fatty acid hydroxylase superfamily)
MFETVSGQWQTIVIVVSMVSLWSWESVSPFFQQGHRIRHAARNIAIALLNALFLSLVAAGITIKVAEATSANQIGLMFLIDLPLSVRIVFGLLVLDFWMYWWHRLNHVVPLLWRFHRMHHSDPQVDVTSASRFHIGEIMLSTTLRVGLIPVIGVPLEAIAVYDLVQMPVISFHHANIGLRPALDRVLNYLVVSPFMHKVHHSCKKTETDSNFSSVFSVWDRLFGTYVQSADPREIKFGILGFEVEERQSIVGMIKTPMFRT